MQIFQSSREERDRPFLLPGRLIRWPSPFRFVPFASRMGEGTKRVARRAPSSGWLLFSLTTRETRSNLLEGIYVERSAHLSTVLLKLHFAASQTASSPETRTPRRSESQRRTGCARRAPSARCARRAAANQSGSSARARDGRNLRQKFSFPASDRVAWIARKCAVITLYRRYPIGGRSGKVARRD